MSHEAVGFPTPEDIEEVISGDFSQAQTPAEAWGVTDEQIAVVDHEAFEKSEDPYANYWDQPGMEGA